MTRGLGNLTVLNVHEAYLWTCVVGLGCATTARCFDRKCNCIGVGDVDVVDGQATICDHDLTRRFPWCSAVERRELDIHRVWDADHHLSGGYLSLVVSLEDQVA